MPFPANTPTPDDLPSLSVAEIAALPVELLAILQREIDERLKRDKAAKTRFDAGLAVRYATRAAEERQLLALGMNFKEGGELYVIDGVLSGLKPENQKIAMKLLAGIDFSKATVLVNMQDNHILGLEGSRLLRLENGHIAFDGKHNTGLTHF